jgi:hypothetical protein
VPLTTTMEHRRGCHYGRTPGPGGRSWEGRGLAYRVGTVGRQVRCAELAGAAGAGRTPGERIDEDVNVARLADRPHYRGQIAEIRRR